jgi:predicted RNase H-like HicB family nuclease
MKTHHILVQQAEEGWLSAHALEDDCVHTQGKTLDEITRNIREVAELLHRETQVQVELVVPSDLKVA